MSKTIIITDVQLDENIRTILAVYNEGKLDDISVDVMEEHLLGNIYVARISDMTPQLGGIFVNFDSDKKAFMSFSDIKNPIIVNKKSKSNELRPGDEILVQISREPLKTKEPQASCNLNFFGPGFIITSGILTRSVSKKLSKEETHKYKQIINENIIDDRLGIVVRTDAKLIDDEVFIGNLKVAYQEAISLIEQAKHLNVYSLVSSGRSRLEIKLDQYFFEGFNNDIKIITDNERAYECIDRYLDSFKHLVGENRENIGALSVSLQKYLDEKIKLSSLFSLKSGLDELINEKVYLKSGAYLIIEQTETLNFIDINSGKSQARKKHDYYVEVNLEAAKEVARQIRMRNLSGMILVDFINLSDKEDEAKLLKAMKEFVKSDPVGTDVLDITKLGLMEITRKKTTSSLKEQIFKRKNNNNFVD